MKNSILFLMLGVFLLAISCGKNSNKAPLAEAFRDTLKMNKGKITLSDKTKKQPYFKPNFNWDKEGVYCRPVLANIGKAPFFVDRFILYDMPNHLKPGSKIYGEGFTMLSQTGGTVGEMVDLGYYNDKDHYRIPQLPDYKAIYGMVSMEIDSVNHILMGFTSCNRFIGKFYINKNKIMVVVDLDGIEIKAKDSVILEEFCVLTGPDKNKLYAEFADRVNKNHPKRETSVIPTGWCSWNGFGPKVTVKNIEDNMDFISKNVPELKYIQIDDGYQAAMGDWLETGSSFGGKIKDVIAGIRKKGFEPAIWVAPFIAEYPSKMFREHQAWFLRGKDGMPLESGTISFGGWRNGPWLVLDGSNPEVQKHLEGIFKTMRNDWGIKYFKLDALFWGAIHEGIHWDVSATRVDAYRKGMEAILRGAGKDAYIMGCNHPLWPSLGLINGSRSSMDVNAKWEDIKKTSKENLLRNWQNGHFWINDPDCILLSSNLTNDEFLFHASVIFASGGVVINGDDLTKVPADRVAILKKLAKPNGGNTNFEGGSFEIGRMALKDGEMIVALNWSDAPKSYVVKVEKKSKLIDYFTDKTLGEAEGEYKIEKMPAHSGKLIKVVAN